MNWRVRLTPDVKSKIAQQGLSREVLMEVYNRLHVDLAADPVALLGEEVVPLAHTKAYNFILGARPPRVFCMFAVRQLPGSDELQVIGGRITQESVGLN